MYPIGPYVLSLVDPSVNVDVPPAARTVDRMPAHVDLGEDSVEVRDAVRLGARAVDPRTGQKRWMRSDPLACPVQGQGMTSPPGIGRGATRPLPAVTGRTCAWDRGTLPHSARLERTS